MAADLNENSTKTSIQAAGNTPDEKLMALYGILFAKLNQEGDGIWGRFNILVGLNLALFAAFGYLCSGGNSRLEMWREIAMSLSFGGLLLSFWSFHILRTLLKWHSHWRDELRKIEKAFPASDGWVKPLNDLPPWLPRPPGKPKRWPLADTEPFFLLFIVAWAALFAALWRGWIN
jgi:hypothetical protein